MTCLACEHPARVHNDDGCRVTACGCSSLVLPEPPKPTSRRVCVDVPDGYAVTFTLTPEAKADD
jgi:hypothetical protein